MLTPSKQRTTTFRGAPLKREGTEYPGKERIVVYHSSVQEKIDALGKATQRLAQRPQELIAELQEELQRVQAEYKEWQRRIAAENANKPNLEAEQLAEARAQLEQLKSELRRSDIARDAARSELSVVQQRNDDLQHELEQERNEMRKLRQERRLLSAPITFDPMHVPPPKQLEHPELTAPPRAALGLSPRVASARDRARPPSAHTSTSGGGASTARGGAARGAAPLATAINSYIETMPVTSDVATQTFAPWHEHQLDWEAKARELQRNNVRLQTALLASAIDASAVLAPPKKEPPLVGSPRRGELAPRPQTAQHRAVRPTGARPVGSATPRRCCAPCVAPVACRQLEGGCPELSGLGGSYPPTMA